MRKKKEDYRKKKLCLGPGHFAAQQEYHLQVRFTARRRSIPIRVLNNYYLESESGTVHLVLAIVAQIRRPSRRQCCR